MKILVLFVEPMLYGMDLIHEVYENTEHTYQYIYCKNKLTGKDDILLPNNAFVCSGTEKEHKKQVISILRRFNPDFVIINGYVGKEQTTAIRYCQKHHMPYAIESDTPLHIPKNKLIAVLKKIYLRRLLSNPYCYGFPGGTPQRENLIYYGVTETKNFIMPMCVSEERLLKASELIPSKKELKNIYQLSGKKVFLFVGRLESVKNVKLLINAFEKLKKQYTNSALVIIGDGSEMSLLKKLVKDKCIEDIYFYGYIVFPEIIVFYKMADIFVLPSNYEPWGLVINEAMIMNLPVVISSAVGCGKDLLRNGENGFVFDNNNENALVECLRKVYDFNVKYKATDTWNYQTYLKDFKDVVKRICEK